MIVSSKLNYVFVSVPKAGTHTMYATLTDSYAGTQQAGPYHQNQVPDEYKDYFCFAPVRHPFDRAVSIWHALSQRPNYAPKFLPLIGGEAFVDFARWISKVTPGNRPTGRGGVLLLSQTEWLEGVRLDRFLKLEHISEEFAELPFVNGRQDLPRLLARDHDKWNDLKCEESHGLLCTRFRKDFARFNYSDDY